MIVVLDAGSLIHLSWIERLDLLEQQFEEVLLPPAVEGEVLRASVGTPGLQSIKDAFTAGWLEVKDLPTNVSTAGLAAARLGPGELEALVLTELIVADLF